jgi:hypothetical protein
MLSLASPVGRHSLSRTTQTTMSFICGWCALGARRHARAVTTAPDPSTAARTSSAFCRSDNRLIIVRHCVLRHRVVLTAQRVCTHNHVESNTTHTQLSNEPFVRLQAASADASDDALHVATGPQSHVHFIRRSSSFVRLWCFGVAMNIRPNECYSVAEHRADQPDNARQLLPRAAPPGTLQCYSTFADTVWSDDIRFVCMPWNESSFDHRRRASVYGRSASR